MIIFVLAVSGGITTGILSAIPGIKLDKDKAVKVQEIDRYTAEITKPDPAVFNRDAINPTVDITIGDKKDNKSDTQ